MIHAPKLNVQYGMNHWSKRYCVLPGGAGARSDGRHTSPYSQILFPHMFHSFPSNSLYCSSPSFPHESRCSLPTPPPSPPDPTTRALVSHSQRSDGTGDSFQDTAPDNGQRNKKPIQIGSISISNRRVYVLSKQWLS